MGWLRQRAPGFLDEMRHGGLQPDVISFIALISACVKGQRWRRTLGFLDQMLHDALQPNMISYSCHFGSNRVELPPALRSPSPKIRSLRARRVSEGGGELGGGDRAPVGAWLRGGTSP